MSFCSAEGANEVPRLNPLSRFAFTTHSSAAAAATRYDMRSAKERYVPAPILHKARRIVCSAVAVIGIRSSAGSPTANAFCEAIWRMARLLFLFVRQDRPVMRAIRRSTSAARTARECRPDQAIEASRNGRDHADVEFTTYTQERVEGRSRQR